MEDFHSGYYPPPSPNTRLNMLLDNLRLFDGQEGPDSSLHWLEHFYDLCFHYDLPPVDTFPEALNAAHGPALPWYTDELSEDTRASWMRLCIAFSHRWCAPQPGPGPPPIYTQFDLDEHLRGERARVDMLGRELVRVEKQSADYRDALAAETLLAKDLKRDVEMLRAEKEEMLVRDHGSATADPAALEDGQRSVKGGRSGTLSRMRSLLRQTPPAHATPLDTSTPAPPPTRIDATTQTDTPWMVATFSRPTAPAAANGVNLPTSTAVHHVTVSSTAWTKRDTTALSSGAPRPFGSIQHRARRSRARTRARPRATMGMPDWARKLKPFDWQGDPRLYLLSRALTALGWVPASE